MGITGERLRLYDFTTPYETFYISIFVRTATVDIKEVSDLGGRKVGVVKANQGLVLMREHGGSDVQIFESLSEAFMALLSGSVDALVYPEQVVTDIAMRSGLEDKIKIIGKPLQEIKRGIAIRKGEPELFLKLDNAVRQLIKTSDYHMIYKKWFGNPEPFWNVTRVIMVMGTVLGLTIASLLFWRYVSILKLNSSLLETLADLKKAEETLRRSEAKYLDLYENAPDMYASVDAATGTILQCNQTFVQTSGYAREEILGRLIFEMYHPDSLEDAKAAFQSFATTGELHDKELQLRRKDGSKLDVSLNESAIRNEAGKILFSRSILHDITALKQAEATIKNQLVEIASYYDNAPIGLAVLDSDLRFLKTNRKFAEINGLPVGKYFGKTIKEIVPDREEQARNIVSKIIETGKPITDIELSGETALQPGIKRTWLESWFPLRVNDDKIISFITVIVQDITERKRTEEEKEKLQAQLIQAQKMESVGRLAGGVAHDYNNALSVIMGFTQLAMDKVDPTAPLHADLEEVLKAANRAAGITRQLLAFARKQTIAPVVLDLNDNVEEMLKMLQRLIGEDISLVWLPGEDLWSVKMDPSQLDQILVNLCVNARDAIAGVGKLTIETDTVTFDTAYCADHYGFVPGEFVMLSVSDNGCGMDKEILDNISEPFFTTKSPDKGTGLGMSMVYGIAKQNNGFINVYSEPGRGTTIRIYLPRHEGKAAGIRDKSTAQIPQGRGETILVVEDDLPILNLAKKSLAGLGYAVLIANTTEAAMDLAAEHAGEINLLITDVIMPEMNGRDLAHQLQSLYPDLKHIFMSGYTANVIAHNGVLDDGVHFIQKPFSRRDLAIIVRKALDE